MCRNVDWDEILAYPTVKIVKVKDRYLGGIRYLMLLIIFLYIVGYVIIMEGGYNLCIVPDGSIELSLLKPDVFINLSDYKYCTQYNKSHPDYNISDPLECQVVDEEDVYQPIDQTNAMFITTRYSQNLQVRNPNCTTNGGCTQPWLDDPNATIYTGQKYYAAAVENFTIRLGHFFQARAFYLESRNDWYSQSCAQMSGKLEDTHGHEIEHYGNDEADIMPLSLILKAANVDINDLSDNPEDRANNESFRHAGLVLFFGINYYGVYKSPVKYTYSVTQVPKVEYKVTRTTTVKSGERLVSNTHGVKIFFEFSGSICQFDFQTLLISCVSGLGLLGLSTLTTDILMQHIMPLRKVYTSYKFKITGNHDALMKHSTVPHIEVSHSDRSSKNKTADMKLHSSINSDHMNVPYVPMDD